MEWNGVSVIFGLRLAEAAVVEFVWVNCSSHFGVKFSLYSV